ncbi:MAG: DUF721 domain-containing protein [Kordiimonas sp.]
MAIVPIQEVISERGHHAGLIFYYVYSGFYSCVKLLLQVAQTIEFIAPRASLMAYTPVKKTTKKKGKDAPAKVYRRFKASSASSVARNLISPAMRAKGFAQAEIVARWAHIVGPELAASTVPLRMIFPRGERMGAKLIIRCESAFAPLLAHKSDRIIEMVNSFFGYGAVAKLEMKQGPLPKATRKPQLEKHALNGEDQLKLGELVGKEKESPLRDALKSLGELVLSNKDAKV